MKLLFTLLLPVMLFALTPQQQRILDRAETFGKPYNLSYSLRAIILQESSAGLHRANYLSGCFGIGQIRLRTYLDRHSIPRNFVNQEKYKSILMYNDFVNMQAIVYELKFWLRVHNGNYLKSYASYFAGYRVSKGVSYAKAVQSKILWLKANEG